MFWLLALSLHSFADSYLEARSGSLSPWSLQFLLNYSGASLSRPLSEFAPNPSQDPVPPRVQLGGVVTVRYRKNSHWSYGLGSGLQVDTPFHGAKSASISNPLVDASWIGFENKVFMSFSFMHYTDLIYRSFFYHSNLAFSVSTQNSVGESSDWRWGLQWGLARNFFSQLNGQLESSVGLYPSLSYQLNNQLSLRTVLTFAAYQFVQEESWVTQRLSQTLGLGWQPHRDLYLYVYLFFNPSPWAEMNSDNTSLGTSLTYNF